MKGQDELFQLIKSLTPSEKRYFKVNASKGGDAKSNYLQLFEAMDKQKEEYDEELLKRKNAKKPFVKYLSAEKKQLREQIMKYMRGYHASRTVDNQINELLQDEGFYKEKGLYEMRIATIRKAKGISQKFERFYLLKEILARELAHVIQFEKRQLTKPVIDLINEQKKLSKTQETLLALQMRNLELFSIYRSGADTKDLDVQNRVSTLITEIEGYKILSKRNFRTRILFFRSYADYHQIQGDWKSSFESTKKEYELYQENEQFKEQDSYNYKLCIANLMSRANSAGQAQWFLKALQEMKTIPVSSFNERGEVFQNVYFSEHLHYINAGEFKKAEALIPIIEKGLKEYQLKINKARLLSFQFNIMVMYFLMHDFKSAIKWAEKLMTDTSKIKQHQKTITTVLLPIIHFELGHFDLVDNLTRSAYRQLKRKKRLHDFERVVLKYLQGMPFSENHYDFTTKLMKFDSNLESLRSDDDQKHQLGLDEISLWVSSRISGKKMYELVT